MSDLKDLLQDAPVPPSDEAQRRTALAAVARTAEHRRRGHVRPRCFLRMSVLAGVGVIALFVAVNVLRSPGDSRGGGSLSSFAALAAEQPQNPITYVRSVSELRYDRPPFWAQGAQYPKQEVDTVKAEVWLGSDQAYEQDVHSYWDHTDRVQQLNMLTDQSADLYCYSGDAPDGGPACTSLGNMGPLGGPPTADLPTDPDELRTALDERSRSLEPPPKHEPPPTACKVSGGGFGAPLPFSAFAGMDRQTLLTDTRAAAGLHEDSSGWTYRAPAPERMFNVSMNLLAAPTTDPAVRAALFQVIAGLDGATLEPDRVDGLGRAASVIEFSSPPPSDSDHFSRDELYVDPETSEVLELRTTVLDGADDDRVLGTYSRTYEERNEVDSLPQSAEPLERELRSHC